MKKNFFFLLIILLLPFVFSVNSAIDAQKLEVEYPPVKINGQQYQPKTIFASPADLVQYIYYFSIGISGAIALIILILAGFRYITSAGNVNRLLDARSQIFSALAGLTILFLAVLILQTINPFLTFLGARPAFPPGLPTAERGVYICTGDLSNDFNLVLDIFKREYDNLRNSYDNVSSDEEAERILTRTKEIKNQADATLNTINDNCQHIKTYSQDSAGFGASYICNIPDAYGTQIRTSYGAIATALESQGTTGPQGGQGYFQKYKSSVVAPALGITPTCEQVGFAPQSIQPFIMISAEECGSCSVTLYEEVSYNREFISDQGGKKQESFTIRGGSSNLMGPPDPGSVGQGSARSWKEFNLSFSPKSIKVEGNLIAALGKSKGEGVAVFTENTADLLSYDVITNWVNCEQERGPRPNQPRPYACPEPAAKVLTLISANFY